MGLFDSGAGSSFIGTCRSALSNYLPTVDGTPVGSHPLVVQFMKGVKNRRPARPKYSHIWDTDIVVQFLKDLDVTSLKNLTLKLVMLLALVTAQRAQTLSLLKLGDLTDKGSEVIFRISAALKTKAAGSAIITLREFTEDSDLCVVRTLKDYIQRTKELRKNDSLLISWMKPYKAVHVDTIRRWILCVMELAGIDITLFKAHSTRSASVSKAHNKNVPLETILDAGMWNNESTFTKFYHKEIHSCTETGGSFQQAVLGN